MVWSQGLPCDRIPSSFCVCNPGFPWLIHTKGISLSHGNNLPATVKFMGLCLKMRYCNKWIQIAKNGKAINPINQQIVWCPVFRQSHRVERERENHADDHKATGQLQIRDTFHEKRRVVTVLFILANSFCVSDESRLGRRLGRSLSLAERGPEMVSATERRGVPQRIRFDD